MASSLVLPDQLDLQGLFMDIPDLFMSLSWIYHHFPQQGASAWTRGQFKEPGVENASSTHLRNVVLDRFASTPLRGGMLGEFSHGILSLHSHFKQIKSEAKASVYGQFYFNPCRKQSVKKPYEGVV